jgi:PAS domain S-box-containing protein
LKKVFSGSDTSRQIEVGNQFYLLNFFPLTKEYDQVIEGGAYIKNITHSVEQVKRIEEENKRKNLEETLLQTKQMLAKLEQEQKKNLAIIDSYVDAFICFDDKGIVEYSNTAFEKMTTYTREETIGAKVGDLLPVYLDVDLNQVILKCKDELSTVINEKTEIMITLKDQSVSAVLASVSSVSLNTSKLIMLTLQKMIVRFVVPSRSQSQNIGIFSQVDHCWE